MSLPSAIGSMPVASATAAPPLLPPQVLVRSYGFSVDPNTGLNVCEPAPNSGVFVLPTTIAPARRRRSTSSESSDGTKSLVNRRAERRPDPSGRLQILVRDRQAVQRADVAAVGELLVGGARAFHRLIGDQGDDRVDARIDALDLREVGADDVARGQLLRANQARELDGAQLADVDVMVPR